MNKSVLSHHTTVYLSITGFFLLSFFFACSPTKSVITSFVRTDSLLMPSVKENPRTSEGAFVKLSDGSIMTVYTKFVGGKDDDAKAMLVRRISQDKGASWGEDKTIVSDEGKMNVMSVSLLRLKDGRLAMFYLIKNSDSDCYPVMRISKDEGRSWSDSRPCATPGSGYYVMNNNRVIQLKSGRILVPVALHSKNGTNGITFSPEAEIFCFYSDDNGMSWKETDKVDKPEKLITQEPGVVELKNHDVLIYIRTDKGYQYFSKSHDGGMTWESARQGNLVSPLAPALIMRDPFTKALVAVWNNNPSQRNPICLAVSSDEGKTWQKEQILQNDPAYWYCYPAMIFPSKGVVLVSYCFGSPKNWGLGGMRIERYKIQFNRSKTDL